jgi:hypothetical protein
LFFRKNDKRGITGKTGIWPSQNFTSSLEFLQSIKRARIRRVLKKFSQKEGKFAKSRPDPDTEISDISAKLKRVEIRQNPTL